MSYFKAKMHQIQFWLGLCPRPCWGTYSAFPADYLDLREPTSKGEGKRWGMGEREREKEGKEWDREGRDGEFEGRGEDHTASISKPL